MRDSFVADTVAAVRYADKLVCLRWRFSRSKGRAGRKKGTLRNGKGRSCHIPDFPVYLDVTKRGGANRHGGTGTTQEAGIATYVRTYVRTYVLVTFRDTRFELSGSCPRAILHVVAAPGASVNGHCTASTPRKTGSFPREIAANESLAALNSGQKQRERERALERGKGTRCIVTLKLHRWRTTRSINLRRNRR